MKDQTPMTPQKIFFLAILAIIATVIAISLYKAQTSGQTPRVSAVSSFEECAKAGFPVLESYPRQCRDDEGNNFIEDIGNELNKIDVIRIASPRPNETIKSPLVVRGEARGTWYFEADFPITLIDADGNVLVETYAEAQNDLSVQAGWMTTDFVPFESTLTFETPETPTGTLILKKDNPSGLPEHDDELHVPVQF